MDLNVPSEKEFQKARRQKKINFGCGLFFGIIFFGIMILRIARYGWSEINITTWMALGFGVLSFAILAAKFGNEFWQLLFRQH